MVCFILPDRCEFDLWNYCVCASLTAVSSQLMTSSETTLKQRCPLEGHQLFSTHITQLQQCRKAKASEQNSGFCSGFSPSDLPPVLADKSASGHLQEAPVCSVEVGSLFSMQSTFLPLPVQVSPLPVLSPQIILTLFLTLHPPSPTSAVWNSLLSVSHVNPPTASKLYSKNLSPVTSQLSWFLSSSVIFMWSFILMEISPRKLGMCHQLPFSHVF